MVNDLDVLVRLYFGHKHFDTARSYINRVFDEYPDSPSLENFILFYIDSFIEEEIECGIVLKGSEVKSMRDGRVSILESYANIEQQQLWLINSYVPNYENAKTFTHTERRRRKLLVKKTASSSALS